MYDLYKPCTQPECLRPIADMFRLHIIQEGQILVKGVETQNPQGKAFTVKDVLEKSHYVEHLLEMLNNYKVMVKDQFNNDALFK
jgi:hypothetical protein